MVPTKIGGDLDTGDQKGVMGLRVRCYNLHTNSAPALARQASDVSAQEEAGLISADLVAGQYCCGQHLRASQLPASALERRLFIY
jgi:hypothetical protein